MKWFQLDADTPNDPKMRAIIRACGVEGFGALVLLWCHIADHGARPGWSIRANGKPLPLDELIEASKLDGTKFAQLVEVCVSSGHWMKKPWLTRKVIAIPAMARRADTYTRRRVRTLVEPSANTVQSEFANNTRQDKQTSTPLTPLPGGRRFTRDDLKEARKIRAARFGRCVHDPQCPDRFVCEAAIATELAERRTAAS